MRHADAYVIFSSDERKAVLHRAGELLSGTLGTEERQEFDTLTSAILRYDIIQQSLAPGEIPPAFMRYLSKRK
jgi:hypothetical protein